MKLTIGHLYPDLLNLYGDRGNIQCFRKRLNWRGIEAEVIPVLSGDNIDFSKLDIVLLGGGSDREQELVCGYLKEIRKDFKEYVEDTTLIINCDDILSYSLAETSGNPFVTYGISEQIFDDISRSEIRESIFCRKCGKKLQYDFFHYGQLGIYHCPNCGWERPDPDFTATQITLKDELYAFDMGDLHLDSTVRTPYNIYNTLAAYTALHTMHAPMAHFKEMAESFDYGNNREEILMINGARVQLHLSKNPIGFQQKISLVLKDPKPKDIIIQINDTYQDGEDVSWLWDVDFQYLADSNAATITTCGTRKHDMGLRLKYEDIDCTSTDDMRSRVEELTENGTKNLYIIVNYSGLYRTNRMLKELAQNTKEQKGEQA